MHKIELTARDYRRVTWFPSVALSSPKEVPSLHSVGRRGKVISCSRRRLVPSVSLEPAAGRGGGHAGSHPRGYWKQVSLTPARKPTTALLNSPNTRFWSPLNSWRERLARGTGHSLSLVFPTSRSRCEKVRSLGGGRQRKENPLCASLEDSNRSLTYYTNAANLSAKAPLPKT